MNVGSEDPEKYNNCTIFLLFVTEQTVGAKSIAHAQSIAYGHIGENISQKNKIFEKLFLQKIKRVNLGADS
jgi:hypothetical protein